MSGTACPFAVVTFLKKALAEHNNNNNNNNLFIYRALFNMLGDQKRITTINNLKPINTNIRNIQTQITHFFNL